MRIGIDNGLDGGLVAINDAGHIIEARIMPTTKKGKGREIDVVSARAWIRQVSPRTVLIEEASKHSAGVLSLCSTWFTFGSLLAMLKLDQYRYEIVNPRTWQKTFWTTPKMPKGQKFDTKAAALNAANKLWPGHDWTKSERASKPHDGMVDAALIAEYGRRMNL